MTAYTDTAPASDYTDAAPVSERIGVAAGVQRWRAPLPYRAAMVAVQTALVAAAADFGWVTLSSNQLPGEMVLAVWVPLWALLAFRAWTVSATLAEDTLVIRNVLSTERVLVADITKVTLPSPRRVLRVTEWRPGSPGTTSGHRDSGERYTVTAVRVGVLASLSGAHCAGDDAADRIAAAAGLPPPPARQPQVSRDVARGVIAAGLALFAAAVIASALTPLGGNPVTGAVRNLGAFMFAAGGAAELGHLLFQRRRP